MHTYFSERILIHSISIYVYVYASIRLTNFALNKLFYVHWHYGDAHYARLYQQHGRARARTRASLSCQIIISRNDRSIKPDYQKKGRSTSSTLTNWHQHAAAMQRRAIRRRAG